jgi:hypothetical protein
MSFHRHTAASAAVFAAAAISLQPANAQLHERRQAQIEQSAQDTPVSGGVTFPSPLPYEKCFDAVSNYLKRSSREIESGNKDTGTLVTAMEIAGKYTQTGTRIHVILIKDSATQTSVRVAVTVQKRKKLLQAEPWSDPKLDDTQSHKTAGDLEQALKSL